MNIYEWYGLVVIFFLYRLTTIGGIFGIVQMSLRTVNNILEKLAISLVGVMYGLAFILASSLFWHRIILPLLTVQ